MLGTGAGADRQVTREPGKVGEGPRADLQVRGAPFCLRCNWTGRYGQEQRPGDRFCPVGHGRPGFRGLSGDGGGGREDSVGPTRRAFRALTGAEPKALEAGPYFLSWSCMMVGGSGRLGRRAAEELGIGAEAGGSRPVGPVLCILTARSPLLGSREADLVDRTAHPLGEGGPPLGQSPLCL